MRNERYGRLRVSQMLHRGRQVADGPDGLREVAAEDRGADGKPHKSAEQPKSQEDADGQPDVVNADDACMERESQEAEQQANAGSPDDRQPVHQ